MRLAIEQAHLAEEHGDVPIGAVIIRDGEVVAAAANERELDSDATAHAELLAIQRASRLLVAFLQAYIFTILTAVYIGGAAHPEH